MGFEAVDIVTRPRTSHLHFLKELHDLGAPLLPGDVSLLREHDIIGNDEATLLLETSDDRIVADALDRYVMDVDMYLERCRVAGFKHNGPIRREDWKCERVDEFDDDYVSFIKSHFVRFCDLKPYKKFWLFIEQAKRWVEEPDPVLHELDMYERRRFYDQELGRMDANPLYGVWKYGKYKASYLPGGEGRWEPTIALLFLCYLICDGRSSLIGKGRQIASTTTITLLECVYMIVRQNFFTKLIACDLETTTEIFEDKLKYAFGCFPDWMKPVVINDKDNLFRVAFNTDAVKGSRKSRTSKVGIVAPKVSAINGGSPDRVLVDEAPLLDIFSKMVHQGSPTLKAKVDGAMRWVRQLVCWGTGGVVKGGGGGFEKDHRKLFNAWAEGDYSSGMVPVFLDWTCRPGITVEDYKREYRKALSGVGDGFSEAEKEEILTEFRQFYPSSVDDMYSVGQNTLLPPAFIVRNQEKVNALPKHLRPKYGHFEPIYDKSKPSPEGSFRPYKIVGAQWVPADEGVVDYCMMFMRPNNKYRFRYIHATDPIVSDEGLSNHASAIWDRHFKTVPCIVDARANDPYIAYEQSKLMGMYYRNAGTDFAHEIVENNIGKAYIKWIQGPEWAATHSLVTNFQLPDFMQGGGDHIGYNSKAGRKSLLCEFGKQQMLSHGANIYIPTLWRQFRYYVAKSGANNTVSYSVDNRKNNKDDVIDAVFMAACGAMAFSAFPCEEVGRDGRTERERFKAATAKRRIWDGKVVKMVEGPAHEDDEQREARKKDEKMRRMMARIGGKTTPNLNPWA